MYKGRHYSRALVKEQTRRALERHLLMHENHGVHSELPRQGYPLPPARRFFYSSEEAEIADRLVLSTYLNYMVNAKTDEERASWWSQAQVHAEKLGLRDYSMSALTKQQTPIYTFS